jgi:PIN domain nuclease of toxin-antitoxin system
VKGYLLDTHVFLWAVQEDNKLSAPSRQIIEKLESKLFLSSITAFEIANKYRIGKLPAYSYVVENYNAIARKLAVAELPISSAHAFFAAKFDWEHRDPFDRILAAQAFLDDLVLITADNAFRSLSWVKTLW